MHKQTLLIIIDNLQKGGAEVLLVGILPELSNKYEVILVTLTGECDFDNKDIVCKEKYVLGFNGKLSFISCIIKLRKIIKKTAPSLIHAHLFYSSLAARLACPSAIPLLYSVHNELSKNIFNNNKLYRILEKITIRKNHAVIAVSKLVLDDYTAAIQGTKKYFVLRNYIADEFFNVPAASKDFTGIKKWSILAVGNIKESKNYEYLVQSFIHLKNSPVSLDIYGKKDDVIFPKLQQIVETNNLLVTFKGQVNNTWQIFPKYDLYIMSSSHEGFGIAAVEAMANGLPVLLSDIPVLREVTDNNALFFNIEDSVALPNLIKQITDGKQNLHQLSLNGIEIAKKYTKQKYIEELFFIYDSVFRQ